MNIIFFKYVTVFIIICVLCQIIYYTIYDNNNTQIDFNYSQKKVTIFCLILTKNDNILNQRVNTVYNEWAYKCNDHRFILRLNNKENKSYETNLNNNSIKLLQPDGLLVDSYSKLTDKVFRMFIDVYKYMNNYDWYLKADDDTFVFVDNLRLFLSDKNSSLPVDYGYDFKIIVPGGYHSGGAGYVLSKGIM